MTSFLQATMNPNTVDVHDATINFVNAFMNADNNTTAALNFLSIMAGLPNPATDAEPVPAPALEAVSEAQEDEDEEEEEEEEAELAEEITVMAEEALDRVETGRDALGDNEEEEESGAVELALDNVGGQGNAEIEVRWSINQSCLISVCNDPVLTQLVFKEMSVIKSYLLAGA